MEGWLVKGFQGIWDIHRGNQGCLLGIGDEVFSRVRVWLDENDESLEWHLVHWLGLIL